MSVAFVQLVSQPKDRLDAHLCGKIPVERTRRSTLKTKSFAYNWVIIELK